MADAEVTPAPEAGGGKKKLAIVGAVAFLIGSGAGIGGAMFMGGGEPPPEEGEEAADLPADGDPDAPVVVKNTRKVVPFDDFTINLRGTGGGRVLRLEVAAEVDEAVLTERMPVLRDAVVTLASDYTYNDLEGLDGKMRLRDELLARLNTSLEQEAKVKRVYFTNFTVQ